MEFQDYTIHNGIGIRVRGKNQSCRVIRLVREQWVEIGSEYSIPIEANALVWSGSGIPATVLAVALRVYELDHPASPLRRMLTGKRAAEQRQVARPEPIRTTRYQFAAAK